MSEKIYAWLLRLYPSCFRKAYGDAALQLFRDRSRDERGLFKGLWLWLDLLADLAVSVPLEYRRAQPALIGASAQERLDGTPVFHVLENGALRLEARLCGGLLSLVAFVPVLVLIGYGGNYWPFGAWAAQPQYQNGARSSVFERPPQAVDHAQEEFNGSGQPTMGTGSMGHGNTEPSGFLSRLLLLPGGSGSPQSQAPQPRPQGATSAAVEGAKLDGAERQRVMDAVIQNLKEHYFDPDVARKMVAALLAHQKSGDDDAVTDGGGFADLLTRQMRNVSQDMHLVVVYSQAPLPEHPPEQTPESLARYRKAMEQENCMFKKVEILPHNIGYLKLNFFPDTSVCQSTATAAMASLNHVDAIIFDLRDNTGGFPSMVSLIASYLFDHPEYMYGPRGAPTEQSWTRHAWAAPRATPRNRDRASWDRDE